MTEEIQTQGTIQVVQSPAIPPKASFISEHLDKLLLLILIVLSYSGFMTLVHWNVAASTVAFSTATVSGFVGALIALVTGKK